MYNYFYDIFYNLLLLLVIIESVSHISLVKNYRSISTQSKSEIFIFIFIFIFALIIGFRPGSLIFGDTSLYQLKYENKEFVYDNEPVFNVLTKFCINIGLNTGLYLSLIALLYIVLPYWFMTKYTNSRWYVLLFLIGSFSFLGYGINGIRNGLALSELSFSFVFLNNNQRIRNLSILIIGALAIGTHKSALLPFICLMISLYFLKDIKWVIRIWLLCIPLSYFLGQKVADMFLGLGYDDRLDNYIQGEFKTGFRWDFIMYSMVPIFFAYYIIKVKNIAVDKVYTILINTYILANAFWVLCITASFSNRFAYLSWFMYPFVISYPILNFKIWNNQENKCAIILFLYFLFSYIMR